MTLNNFIKNLPPAKMLSIHFSKRYMFIHSQIVWDLDISTLEEQPEELKEKLIRMLR